MSSYKEQCPYRIALEELEKEIRRTETLQETLPIKTLEEIIIK